MYRQHTSVQCKRTEGEIKKTRKKASSLIRGTRWYINKLQTCTSLKSPRKGTDVLQHYKKFEHNHQLQHAHILCLLLLCRASNCTLVIEGAIIQSEQIATTVVKGNHTGKQCHNRKTGCDRSEKRSTRNQPV